MDEALKLLIASSMPIKEIGFRLGYADESHFSKAFKAFYKSTPGKLRATHSGSPF